MQCKDGVERNSLDNNDIDTPRAAATGSNNGRQQRGGVHDIRFDVQFRNSTF
jgi:hypothetical protein